jgi:hypothetical protein
MRSICVLLAALVLVGSSLNAQGEKPSFELSVDFAVVDLSFSGGDSWASVEIGDGIGIRLGIPVSALLTIEPWVKLSFFSTDEVTAFYTSLAIGVPFYFSKSFGRKGLFIRPEVGFAFYNAEASSTGDSAAQPFFSGGMGYKLPVGDQASLRLEAQVVYALETDDFYDQLSIVPVFGISVFF